MKSHYPVLNNVFKQEYAYAFMKNLLVADIMTREPITVQPSTNLLECARKMVKKRVGSLPLLAKKKLVGFISEKDIMWAMIKKSRKDLKLIKAIDISPKKIATIKPLATLKEAVQKMNKAKHDKLLVIHNKEFAGMITAKDILNFHPELYSELDDYAEIREESTKLKRLKQAKNRDFIHEGICEECGNRDVLRRVHGVLMCESCERAV